MMLRALFPFMDKQCKTQADVWVRHTHLKAWLVSRKPH